MNQVDVTLPKQGRDPTLFLELTAGDVRSISAGLYITSIVLDNPTFMLLDTRLAEPMADLAERHEQLQSALNKILAGVTRMIEYQDL